MEQNRPVLLGLPESGGQEIDQHENNYSQSNYHIIQITSKSRDAERMGLTTEL